MIVNTYEDVEQLAQYIVLDEMKKDPQNIERLDVVQREDTIFYKVYDDLCKQNSFLGSMFAEIMKSKFEINILIN